MFSIIKARFETKDWTIGQLVQLYKEKRVNLNPYYQRNSIWSLSTQRCLIDTIQKGSPIPTFFVRVLSNNKYEMVDGQQRSRSIIGYWNGEFADQDKLVLSEVIKNDPRNKKIIESLSAYKLSVTLLDESFTDKEIEDFYVLVNSSGMHINRPELFKAAYYSTRFLKLATELAGFPLFEELSLFSDKSSLRMNDIDYMSELLALLQFGFTDKKVKVDELYESDISEAQYKSLKSGVEAALNRINALNKIVAINKTRFKQKGDFYTLFGFVANHPDITEETLQYFYRILLKLSPHIRPSQEECDPLMDYAVNCVTQSNSKKAREARNKLFEELFLNKTGEPNDTQRAIAKYLHLTKNDYVRMDSHLVFRLEAFKVGEAV
jgi:hypothetical protein